MILPWQQNGGVHSTPFRIGYLYVVIDVWLCHLMVLPARRVNAEETARFR